VLFLAGNHPDFHPTGIEEKASFIKVDQIRDLCSRLAMRSFRGAAKVALIDPADRMNPSSHNALLKTLEEPTDDTLLLLTATRIDRLPPTVASRCQRIRIPAPPAGNAVAWLQSRAARDDWPQLLALAAGAPLRALELAESGAGELLQDMAAALPGPPASAFDPFGLAEAWSKDRPADRLAWLEWWLESRIRRWATVSDVVNNNRDNDLPSVPAEPNIRTAFALLERVRDARAQLEGPLNSLLLFEDLLVSFAEAFAGSTVARPETQG
jgi:DNA polymerase-3 subunit delta'